MKNQWIEVPAGTTGLLRTGKFIQMGETEVTKVTGIRGDEVIVLDGAVTFKAADVTFIN